MKKEVYKLPKVKHCYAGIVLTLSLFKNPDLSSFADMEVCFRVLPDYHTGLIVKSTKKELVLGLLDDYADRLFCDFANTASLEPIKNLN